MNKADMRKLILEQFKKLSEKEKQSIESTLHNQLFKSAWWKKANSIGMTYATSFEWDTYPIMQKAWNQNKIVLLPKVDPTTYQLHFYKVEHMEQLDIGYARILEPNTEKCTYIPQNAIELLLVPGIAFNRDGYRIGFGGGYYDRFLVNYKGRTVSLVSQLQLVDQLAVHDYDIPVENIVTEEGCFTIS